MNLKRLIDQFTDNNIEEEKKSGTFKCPECGSKVLNNTSYCVKCKKKVSGGPSKEAEGDGDSE